MATLVYCDGDGASAHVELSGTIVVGSAEGCAIRSHSPDVEAEHARIFESDGAFWIEDLSSSGGVFVEAEPVTQRRFSIGEVVVIGPLMLRVDDTNGEPRPLTPSIELLRLLAIAHRRNRELEDERNALGRRVGELHEELAAERESAAVVIGPPRDAVEYDLVDTTAPMASGFAPDLEEMAEKVRQTTRAVEELEQKLRVAEDRRAEIAERAAEAEIGAKSSDPTERELREVQLLSLNAQLAELDKACDSKRSKLNARRQELAVLRSRLEMSPRSPRTTQEYGAARADTEIVEDAEKLAELKERFEAEFERAVTLQQKLKTAEARIEELEASNEALEGDLEKAVGARQAAEQKLREAQATAQKPADVKALERRVGDLEKLLEAAKKEASRLRRKATEVGDAARDNELRIEELEAASASSAEQAAAAATRVAELSEALEARNGELRAARDRVAELEAEAAASAAATAEQQRELDRLEELEAGLAKAEKARDAAQAERRAADVRILDAESKAREMAAKLEVAERRVEESKARVERLGRELEGARGELVEARDHIDALMASSDRENTGVIRLEHKLEQIRDESDAEIDLLSKRVKELERDLDRALDAEQVALAKADAEAAAKQEEIDRLNARLEEVSDELATTSERLASIRHELAEAQDREELLIVERDALKSRLDEIDEVHQGELAKLTAELDNTRTTSASELGEVRAAIEAQLDQARDEHEAALATARGELDKVRGELEDARETIAGLETERRTLLVDRDRAMGLERELNNVRNALRDTRAEVGGLREQLATAKGGAGAAKDLRSRVVQLASQNAQISAELVALGEEKKRVESELTSAKTEIDTLQRELTEVRHELTDTHKNHSELTRRYEQVAEELERASIDMEALRSDVADSSREDLERECRALRERVADLELHLAQGFIETTENIARPDTLSDDVELTAVADPSPALVDWMLKLQDAIGDLRMQMRTAADESVMLESSDSVEIISTALSSAVARVESAREAIRNIIELIGLDDEATDQGV